jgi:hypothetical protein
VRKRETRKRKERKRKKRERERKEKEKEKRKIENHYQLQKEPTSSWRFTSAQIKVRRFSSSTCVM